MNKRQIKKKVKQAKLNKERGLILSLEERHYIRNYGDRYYTKSEVSNYFIDWDELTNSIRRIFDGVTDAFADMFQGWADSLRARTEGRTKE